MRRLPNVYPADTITWPNQEGTFDVGSASNNSRILMRNLTPLNLRLDFYNGSTDVLSAWEHNVWPLDGDSPTIGWSIDPDSPSVIAPPSNVVYLTLFDSTEKVPGTYPVFSVLQTSSGTTSGTGGTGTVNQLINTGNAAGQNVVTVNSTATAGSTWTVSTDGLFQLMVTIAAALVNAIKTNETDPILQLGDAGHLTEILGTLQLDQNVTMKNNVSFRSLDTTGTSHNILRLNGANVVELQAGGQNEVDVKDVSGNVVAKFVQNAITLNQLMTATLGMLLPNGIALEAKDGAGTAHNMLSASSDNHVHVQSMAAGAEVDLEDSAGALMGWFNSGGGGCANGTFQVPKLLLSSGSLAHFDKTHFTAAAGTYPTTKTYNHGLSYTPDFIIIMPGENVASFGSCTIGVWNWNATTFDVTLGAQINFQAFFIKLNV